jgi:site-specific DNA recombinase
MLAAGEIKRKGKRQVDANKQRAEAGRPSQGGRRAFGWEVDGVTIRESEAVHVRRMYAGFLARTSLRSLAQECNDAGVVTVVGLPFTPNAVRHVIGNARHAAILVRKGVEIGPGAWPALVDEPMYRAAAAILADPSRRSGNAGGQKRRLMTGIGLCGVCDDGMTTVRGGSRGKACRSTSAGARTRSTCNGSLSRSTSTSSPSCWSVWGGPTPPSC